MDEIESMFHSNQINQEDSKIFVKISPCFFQSHIKKENAKLQFQQEVQQ